jgi:1-acyl-sn-glycerol-3-phosphate acyltransferase
MLYPHKQAIFSRWFTWVIHRRLRATFGQVTVHGLEHVVPNAGPMLLVSNHTSFWDALMIVWLSERVLCVPGYAWMHRHNLARLPFFRLLGAFGVDGQAPADIKAGLAYVRQRLQGGPCALWIFPQGDEKPAARRPLGFAGGSAWIARRNPEAAVIPVALHYGFGTLEKPEAHVCFGAPLPGAKATPTQHEGAVTALLDACACDDAALSRLAPGEQTYLPQQSTIAEPLAVRWLSCLCRWYLGPGR